MLKPFNRALKSLFKQSLFCPTSKLPWYPWSTSNCRPQNNSPELGVQVQSMDCGLQHCPPHHLISSSYPHTPHNAQYTQTFVFSIQITLFIGLAAHADGHGRQ